LSETLANLDSLLDAAGLGSDARYGADSLWRVYVRNAADASLIERRLRAHFAPETQLLLLRGDICRAELMVEIDGVHGI